MKPLHVIAAAALAIASTASLATCPNGGSNWPNCNPPATPSAPSTSTNTLSNSNDVRANSDANAQSASTAVSSATVSGSSSAAGGAGGSASLADFSRQNMYVLPAPVNAAPLPAGLCPQGDSLSVGILWNMFSYARSSTRTEMECLERVLASVKAAPEVRVIQAPALPPQPPASAAPAPAPRPASKPAKRVVKTAEACAPAAQSCAIKR